MGIKGTEALAIAGMQPGLLLVPEGYLTICQAEHFLPNSVSAPAFCESPHSLLLEHLTLTFTETPPKALTLLKSLPHPKSNLTSILSGPGDTDTLLCHHQKETLLPSPWKSAITPYHHDCLFSQTNAIQ